MIALPGAPGAEIVHISFSSVIDFAVYWMVRTYSLRWEAYCGTERAGRGFGGHNENFLCPVPGVLFRCGPRVGVNGWQSVQGWPVLPALALIVVAIMLVSGPGGFCW